MKYTAAVYRGKTDQYENGKTYHIAVVRGTFYPYAIISQELPDLEVEYLEAVELKKDWELAKATPSVAAQEGGAQ